MKTGICVDCKKDGKIYAKGLCPTCYNRGRKNKKEPEVVVIPRTFEPYESDNPQKDFCAGRKPLVKEESFKPLAEVEETIDSPLTIAPCTVEILYHDNLKETVNAGTVPRYRTPGILTIFSTDGWVIEIAPGSTKTIRWKVNGGKDEK